MSARSGKPQRRGQAPSASASASPAGLAPAAGWSDWRLLSFLAGYLVFLGFYLLTPLGELPPRDPVTGEPFRRLDLLTGYLLDPAALVAPWFGAPGEFGILDRLPILASALLLISMAGLIGRTALLVVGAERGLTTLEQATFSIGVGLNLVSLYTLLVGWAGWLRSDAGPLLFAIPAAIVISVGGRQWARRPATEPVQLPDEAEPLFTRRWLWLVAPLVAITLLGGMLPPVEFDVREYHLQAPKEFYQSGQISFLPHNVYANMPLGGEMLALLAMVAWEDWWFGALVGKTILACYALLGAALVYCAGRRLSGTTAGVVGAICYLSTPWIVKTATAGLVEPAVAFYVVAAVYATLLWQQSLKTAPETTRGRLLMAGFLAGAAVAFKYPAALFVVVPLVAWVKLASWRQARWEMLRTALLFSVAVLAGCGAWLLKNWVFTGNPVYPLLYDVFGGSTRTPELNARWTAAHSPANYQVADLFARFQAVIYHSPWQSAALVPLAVASLFNRTARGWLLPLAGYLAFFFASWWLLTHRIDRFWVPALGVLALVAGAGAVWNRSRAWRIVVAVVLILGTVLCFVQIPGGPLGYTRYFVALKVLRDSPERVYDPWHRWLNQELGETSTVLLVGDAEVFDLQMNTIYNTVFDPVIFEQWARDREPAEVRNLLAAHGVDYVYVHWGEIARYREPGNYGFSDWVHPEVFAHLVEQGILLPPLPAVAGHPGQMFPVNKRGADE